MASNTQETHRVGAHCSIAGGHHNALTTGAETGCEVVQIFTKNNMQWSGPEIDRAGARAFGEAREATGIRQVFAHSSYLINLCATDPATHRRSREALLDELTRCHQLKLPFLVLHPGAHLGAGEETGLAEIARSLDWVLERAPGKARVALEITAGQGTVLGYRVEHLAAIIAACRFPQRLVVCLDTCHLFAAGYDLRRACDVRAFVKEFKRHLSWRKVACLHINDSKHELGSRKDRHELIGQGRIGWECFETILHDRNFARLPLCLETPKGTNSENDIRTLRKLKEIRGRKA